MSSKPEHTIRCGGIQIAVWSNETPKGTFQSITIDKSYKDGETWKRTKSFKATDLIKVQIGINKVLEYLYLKPYVLTPKTDESQF